MISHSISSTLLKLVQKCFAMQCSKMYYPPPLEVPKYQRQLAQRLSRLEVPYMSAACTVHLNSLVRVFDGACTVGPL